MSYEPREFWEQRLRQQFDLRGTGETELSLAYNRACYALRREALERALDRARVETRGGAGLGAGWGARGRRGARRGMRHRLLPSALPRSRSARARGRHPLAVRRAVAAAVPASPL